MKSTEVETEVRNVDCPHCKGKIEVEIERKPAKVKFAEIPDIEDIVDRKFKERELKQVVDTPKPEKKKEKVVAPAYQPRFVCSGSGCEGHDNPNYQVRPQKRCTNCNMWGGPASVKKCPTCGSEEDFEEVDDDELDALNIPKPQHKHSHEEEQE